MRSVELPGGIPVFLSNKEYKVYESINGEVLCSSLSEHNAYVAQGLVNKGVVSRQRINGQTYFTKTQGSIQ